VEYIPATHICQGGSARPAKCNNESYNPLEHKCEDGILKNRCGVGDEFYYILEAYDWYNPATEFCYEGNKVGDFCGDNPQKYYDPNLYQCKQSVNLNGIFLKNPVSYEGESYEAVLIGSQVWLARNLNYRGTEPLGGCLESSDANCNIYGRLYNWATAMKVCPSGWHLPSDEEWDALMTAVGGSSTAGTALKSRTGWITDIGYIPGTNIYGFSALGGGNDILKMSGLSGDWWSSSEYDSDFAYYRYMDFESEYVNYGHSDKSNSFSVRCLKD
jgi:uncharacterized protein (TIGR02145 family)